MPSLTIYQARQMKVVQFIKRKHPDQRKTAEAIGYPKLKQLAQRRQRLANGRFERTRPPPPAKKPKLRQIFRVRRNYRKYLS